MEHLSTTENENSLMNGSMANSSRIEEEQVRLEKTSLPPEQAQEPESSSLYTSSNLRSNKNTKPHSNFIFPNNSNNNSTPNKSHETSSNKKLSVFQPTSNNNNNPSSGSNNPTNNVYMNEIELTESPMMADNKDRASTGSDTSLLSLGVKWYDKEKGDLEQNKLGQFVSDLDNTFNHLKQDINSHRKKHAKTAFKYALCPTGIACMVVIIFIIVLVLLFEFSREKTRSENEYQVAMAAQGAIKRQIDVSLTSLDLTTETVKTWNYEVNSSRFIDLAARMKEDSTYKVVDTFELTRNYTISYIYPMASHESLVGVEIGSNPLHLVAIEKSIATNSTTIFGPVLTLENTYSFIAQQPIFYDNGTLFGFSVGLLFFSDVFSSINLTKILQDYSYQLYDYNQDIIFLQHIWGENSTAYENVFSNQSIHAFSGTTINLEIQNAKWMLILKPHYSAMDAYFTAEIVIPIFVFLIIPMVLYYSRQMIYFTLERNTSRFIIDQLQLTVERSNDCLIEVCQKLDRNIKKFGEEERKLEHIINCLEDALITVEISNNLEILIKSCNKAFYEIFDYQESDFINEKFSLCSLFPTFDIKKEYLVLKQKVALGDQAQFSNSTYELTAKTKSGKDFRVTISLTINWNTKDRFEDTTLCVLLVRPLSLLKKRLDESEKEYNFLKNKMEFLRMFKASDLKQKFIAYLQQYKRQDNRNIVFLEDVQRYKNLTNIQERFNMKYEIARAYIDCPHEKDLLYDIPLEDLKTTVRKVMKSINDVELFTELEDKVIQSFFKDNTFHKWQEYEEEQQATKKAGIFRSKISFKVKP